jgi:hypothetical protein
MLGGTNMTWALVTMMCLRMCQPQYVELYPTKEACVAVMKPGTFSTQGQYCIPAVPIVKEK